MVSLPHLSHACLLSIHAFREWTASFPIWRASSPTFLLLFSFHPHSFDATLLPFIISDHLTLPFSESVPPNPRHFISSPSPSSMNNTQNVISLSPRAALSSTPPPTNTPTRRIFSRDCGCRGGGGGGAKLLSLAISVAVGVLFRFCVPRPVHVSRQAWQLLAIFLSTITGLVVAPLPVGAWAFVALTVSVVTRTLSFSDAFSAFTNQIIWLIVISFFFARGFVKTGLGDRIATCFVRCLGKSTLGLSYGLTLSEALISPAMPSTTARAGGVFLPIIKSLSLSYGSRPGDSSSKKLGSYLIQSQLQSACSSSALFLTAAAQNLLCLKLAEELGIKVASPWVSWFKAASLPALASLIATPYFLYKISPPEIKNTPDAPALAVEKLKQMGSVTRNEWVMILTMLVAVSLWIFGEKLGVASVVAAMLGMSMLLLLGVLDWDDCLSEKSAWDTLAWFAVLVGMASQLTNHGIVSWLSNYVAKILRSFSLCWPGAFFILQASYFIIHYLFASQTAHVAALYSAFLAMHLASGVPGVLAALSLAYNTNLFGALTHYSSGQAAVYYGAGYVDLPDVFRIGIITALVNVVIWGVVGIFWWKLMGIY